MSAKFYAVDADHSGQISKEECKSSLLIHLPAVRSLDSLLCRPLFTVKKLYSKITETVKKDLAYEAELEAKNTGLSRRMKAMWAVLFTLVLFLGLSVAATGGVTALLAKGDRDASSQPRSTSRASPTTARCSPPTASPSRPRPRRLRLVDISLQPADRGAQGDEGAIHSSVEHPSGRGCGALMCLF